MSSKMKKIKCQACRVESCFNHVIELNKKMLILTMISYKKKIWVIFGVKRTLQVTNEKVI
jgi:hypothetical protein